MGAPEEGRYRVTAIPIEGYVNLEPVLYFLTGDREPARHQVHVAPLEMEKMPKPQACPHAEKDEGTKIGGRGVGARLPCHSRPAADFEQSALLGACPGDGRLGRHRASASEFYHGTRSDPATALRPAIEGNEQCSFFLHVSSAVSAIYEL